MPEQESKRRLGPERPRWTHMALRVNDVEASIAWYCSHTHLELLARLEDESGHSAWLGDSEDVDSPFVLVLAQFYKDKDPFASAPHAVLAPFAHVGIELPAREMVDEAAKKAGDEGCLALGPLQMPDPVGYICFVTDPDGNTIEFSHDQGVYEKAKEVWG